MWLHCLILYNWTKLALFLQMVEKRSILDQLSIQTKQTIQAYDVVLLYFKTSLHAFVFFLCPVSGLAL